MVYNVEMGFINHPDHRAAGQSALDAVYPLARDHLSFPELYRDEGLAPHNVHTVLLTNFSTQNCYIDVSKTFETKMRALAAHDSQIPDVKALDHRLRGVAEKLGNEAGVRYAEGFIRLDIQ
jgi:LmbE family N-acetylglucosaminyl deacetylase